MVSPINFGSPQRFHRGAQRMEIHDISGAVVDSAIKVIRYLAPDYWSQLINIAWCMN